MARMHVGSFRATRFHRLAHTAPPRNASLRPERLAERVDVRRREPVEAPELARLEVGPAGQVDVVARADLDPVGRQVPAVGGEGVWSTVFEPLSATQAPVVGFTSRPS